MHHITPGLLRHSYDALKRDAAAGVDEVTWHEYREDLESRLLALHARVQSEALEANLDTQTGRTRATGRHRRP